MDGRGANFQFLMIVCTSLVGCLVGLSDMLQYFSKHDEESEEERGGHSETSSAYLIASNQ